MAVLDLLVSEPMVVVVLAILKVHIMVVPPYTIHGMEGMEVNRDMLLITPVPLLLNIMLRSNTALIKRRHLMQQRDKPLPRSKPIWGRGWGRGWRWGWGRGGEGDGDGDGGGVEKGMEMDIQMG